jgi:hypothetical protein
MQYLGIDWGTRRAAWCALSPSGELTEGAISADEEDSFAWSRGSARRSAAASR